MAGQHLTISGTPARQSVAPPDPVTVLRLIRSRRVGPATFHRMMAEYGSPDAALAGLPEVAKAAGMSDYAPCPAGVAKAELAAGRKAGARLLTWFDAEYPAALREIADAPPVIWVCGNMAALGPERIAVIGARNASSLGLRMARALSGGLGKAGIVTVAGLARGIDTITHETTLKTGTIAVVAGGIDVCYPSENAPLFRAIRENGLILGEQPPGMAPMARHFPARNRIISGLSRAVVVVEAAERSGSLLTARNALDQGREVMAVPGHPMDARASGCNNLIRDGATLVRTAGDVLTALGHTDSPAPAPQIIEAAPAAQPSRSEQIRRRILEKLGLAPTDENALIRDLGLPVAEVAPAMLQMELSGEVQRMPGGLLARQ